MNWHLMLCIIHCQIPTQISLAWITKQAPKTHCWIKSMPTRVIFTNKIILCLLNTYRECLHFYLVLIKPSCSTFISINFLLLLIYYNQRLNCTIVNFIWFCGAKVQIHHSAIELVIWILNTVIVLHAAWIY